MSVLLTLSINIIFYCAGVATPDPGEAPPLAEFNMKSPVVYIAPVRLFLSAALCKNHEASPQSAQSPQRLLMLYFAFLAFFAVICGRFQTQSGRRRVLRMGAQVLGKDAGGVVKSAEKARGSKLLIVMI